MNSQTFLSLAFFLAMFTLCSGANIPKRTARQMETIENAVTEGVKNNVIGSLSKLGQATGVAGTNVSRAAALLIRGIVHEGFSLGSAAAYIPRLVFLDGPNQFIETLRLIRSNRITLLPNDMNSAIDNLITYTGSLRDSGIPGRLSPIVEFFPNIFKGVEKFVQTFVYNAMAFVGPLPPPAALDKVVSEQNFRVAASTDVSV